MNFSSKIGLGCAKNLKKKEKFLIYQIKIFTTKLFIFSIFIFIQLEATYITYSSEYEPLILLDSTLVSKLLLSQTTLFF